MIGDHDSRRKLAEAAYPGEEQASANRRPGERQSHFSERCPPSPAQGGGHIFEHGIDGGEARTRGNDKKRGSDENLGQHDTWKRVCERTMGEQTDRRIRSNQKEYKGAAGQRK